jgi:hypothetical protein
MIGTKGISNAGCLRGFLKVIWHILTFQALELLVAYFFLELLQDVTLNFCCLSLKNNKS